MAIHDVEMEPVRARFFDAVDFRFQMGEIRGEDGWSDESFRERHDGQDRKGKTSNAERPTSNPELQRASHESLCIRHWMFGVGRSTFSPSSHLSLDDTRARFMLPRFQPVVIALAGQHARLERAVERLI
jgi:hypothetical protein